MSSLPDPLSHASNPIDSPFILGPATEILLQRRATRYPSTRLLRRARPPAGNNNTATASASRLVQKYIGGGGAVGRNVGVLGGGVGGDPGGG